MGRLDAVAVTTAALIDVIDVMASGNRAYEVLMSPSVDEFGQADTIPTRIAVAVDATEPEPTRSRLLDGRLEGGECISSDLEGRGD